jgi:hypothetical protein
LSTTDRGGRGGSSAGERGRNTLGTVAGNGTVRGETGTGTGSVFGGPKSWVMGGWMGGSTGQHRRSAIWKRELRTGGRKERDGLE